MTMNDPDKLAEQLSAYVDGELDDKERAAVQAMLRENATARAELERLRETAAMVRAMPRASAPATTARDVMTAIERGDLIGDESAPTTFSPWRRFRSLLLTAATIGLTVGVGLWGLSLSVSTEEAPQVAQIEEPLPPPAVAMEEAVGRGSPAAASKEAGDTRPTLATPKVLPGRRRGEFREMDAAVADARADTVVSKLGSLTVQETAEPATTPTVATSYRASKKEAEFAVDAWRAEQSERAALSATAADEYRNPPPSDLELEIICADTRDLEWCRERLDRFMGEQDTHSANMEWYALLETVLRFGDSGDAPPPTMTDSVERQVSMPATRLRQLVAVFDAGPSARREVKLSVGALLQTEGWSQTQLVLTMMVPTESVDSLTEKDHGMRVSGRTNAPHGRMKTSVMQDRIDEDSVLVPPPAKPARVATKLDTPAAERLITVTIRLRSPALLAKPVGEPGRLVPTLTENPK